ncbi:MAG: pirin family protein [Acidimicrobiales bacterium]|nr:pirin family protein [Acidimicrobiales bacterium]MCB9393999.1 pirin family protein [Acidimicrobiaceae bacterium]
MNVASARNQADQAVDTPVLQRFPIGVQWPTTDPFLFCVHHLDHYPAGTAEHGPAASLDGRAIGQDFAGTDGWRMYHGQRVPGFPQHPHRGFETVTFVRRGLVDHSDSLGARARYGGGDVQWLTAGSGIVHSEMFPLLATDADNPVELFQIWLNLPRDDKFAEPHFSMLWADELPRFEVRDTAGHLAEITVIAGELAGHVPPPPPPSSYASRADSDVAIWHVRLEPGASFTLPPAADERTVRVAYVFDGAGVAADADADALTAGTGAVMVVDRQVVLSSEGGAEVLVLQGRPIGEPVAQYGPFVMNDRAGIEQAFADYRRTGFGGWPWPSDEPVHGGDPARFAERPDGSVERPRGGVTTATPA